jgi:TRAP-type C4-dicarboxylate transport system permease small subunit
MFLLRIMSTKKQRVLKCIANVILFGIVIIIASLSISAANSDRHTMLSMDAAPSCQTTALLARTSRSQVGDMLFRRSHTPLQARASHPTNLH